MSLRKQRSVKQLPEFINPGRNRAVGELPAAPTGVIAQGWLRSCHNLMPASAGASACNHPEGQWLRLVFHFPPLSRVPLIV